MMDRLAYAGVDEYNRKVYVPDPNGTHALMPWEDYERLLKVVDAAEALIQAQQKPGERVPVTYYADFGRRIQTLRDALREPEDA